MSSANDPTDPEDIQEATHAEEAVQSPYIESALPQFDYDAYQDQTTVKAIAEILRCIGRNADFLVYTHDTPQEEIIDKMSTVGQKILNILIDCKVPDMDLQTMSDKLAQIPFQLFKLVARQSNEFEKELLARYIGTRDPGTKKYSREYATLGDMFQALIKLRADQGNNAEDYFFIKKKEE